MKKEYIVLAVVIVALVAYLVSRNRDRNLYELPQIESVQTKEITRVELTIAKWVDRVRQSGKRLENLS